MAGAGLFLSAEVPDYSDALVAISQQLTNLGVSVSAMSETVHLLVGVASGIVCFLGIIFGFKFIKFLLEMIRR